MLHLNKKRGIDLIMRKRLVQTCPDMARVATQLSNRVNILHPVKGVKELYSSQAHEEGNSGYGVSHLCEEERKPQSLNWFACSC